MTHKTLDAQNAALLLIDHQKGTIAQVKSISSDELKRNALMLAHAASIFGIPAVLTSSMEDHMQGPLIGELEEILPEAFAARVKRSGVVNAMADCDFASAVRATGRRKLIVAGVTNDVCTVFPVLDLIDQGFDVIVAADAGGSPSAMGDDLALQRMKGAGALVIGTNQIVADLVQDWSTDRGKQMLNVIVQSMPVIGTVARVAEKVGLGKLLDTP